MDQNYFKYVMVLLMITNNDKQLIKLQQRNYDLQETILKTIEILKEGNIEKALKILKKVLYEK